MNEQIEYAEMLEIPVSTVNVIRKKHGKKRNRAQKNTTDFQPDLKSSVIAQINDKMSETPAAPVLSAEPELFAESANSAGKLLFDDVPERVDTIRLYGENEHPYGFDDFANDETAEEFYGENEREYADEETYQAHRKERRLRLALGAEFALACALCGAIFLTNVFVPESAINTFFRSLGTPAQTQETDARTYSDFTLSGVVSEYADVELSLSETGVLTLADACCVYPAADGTVTEVSQTADGSYTLKIAHSDTFTGVFSGLQHVYYDVGAGVKSNVPVGYSGGETEVQVTMYSNGALLNCFQITEENCLAWITQE